MAISKRVAERISMGLKKYQPILADARSRDISETDTVMIVSDMLADLLGYKKFVEITAEHAIKGTYVDLAVKVGEETRFLLEAKAIGVELKDAHVKQAIDYGANKGIEWVILTNGATWRVYKIIFKQPIDKSLVFELDALTTSPKNAEAIECLGNLSREGFTQSSMTALLQQRQATGKFSVAAILLSEPVIAVARRELRRCYPNVRIDEETLRQVIETDVLKREVVDSEEARAAQQALKKAMKAAARAKAKAASVGQAAESGEPPIIESAEAAV